jgi:hypothetical protein
VPDLLAAHGITADAVADCLGVAPPSPPDRAPLGEDDAVALRSLGIDLDAIREAVERQFGEGALDADAATNDEVRAARRRFVPGGHIRFARGSKKVLELSLREALRTGAREIRTEHIALGVLRADDEAVTMLLRTLGVDVKALRADLEGGLDRRSA